MIHRSDGRELVTSNLQRAKVQTVSAICADPLHSNGWWIGDYTCVRYCDGNAISLVAGGEENGAMDGVGGAARFSFIHGLICTRNRKRLYLSDHDGCTIRMIDLATQTVTTVAGSGRAETVDGHGYDASFIEPCHIAFDRSSSAGGGDGESAVWITAESLRRLNLTTRIVTTAHLDDIKLFPQASISCTPDGTLILANRSTMYMFDPVSERLTILAGSPTRWGCVNGSGVDDAQFSSLHSVVVIDRDQCVYVTDASNHQIRRVTLPAIIFQRLLTHR